MDYGKKVEIAAITIGSAIAVAGLLIAIGQFLSQIFGSLEGYRRCQSSVLGIFWYKRTTLRWRWTQFRCEVLFNTPELYSSSRLRLPPCSSPTPSTLLGAADIATKLHPSTNWSVGSPFYARSTNTTRTSKKTASLRFLPNAI